MYRAYTRAMLDSERSELQRRLDVVNRSRTPLVTWGMFWFTLLGAGPLIGGAVYIVSLTPPVAEPVTLLPCIAIPLCGLGAMLAFAALRRGRRESDLRRLRVQLRSSIACGVVHARNVRASAVVVIEEFEDEGNTYVFEIGDDRLIVLQGQEFDPPEIGPEWPCSHFELVYDFSGEFYLGTVCHGEKLEPLRVVQSHELRDEHPWYRDMQVLDGSLREYLHNLVGDE